MFTRFIDTSSFIDNSSQMISFLVIRSPDTTIMTISSGDFRKLSETLNMPNKDTINTYLNDIVRSFFELKVVSITYLSPKDRCFSIIIRGNIVLYFDPNEKCAEEITTEKYYLDDDWFYIDY